MYNTVVEIRQGVSLRINKNYKSTAWFTEDTLCAGQTQPYRRLGGLATE